MLGLANETQRVVSLQAHDLPASASALELAFTTVLRRKGRALDSLINRRRARRAGTMAAADRQPAPITIASIQAALPRGAALVEFVRYHRVDPKLPARPQVEHYLAYVLPSQGSPSFVPLGEAAPIDQEIGTLFVAMHTSLKPTDGDPGGVDPMMKSFIQAMRKRHLKRLDDLLLAPVRAHLRNVTHLILSPDSALHAVPFEALVDGEGHYEIERRLVSYVTSGRDLLRFHDPRPPRSPATIIAVPDYGVPGATVSPARSSFRRLEGALSEVTTLTAHFASVRTITGKDATKAALADLPPPCASDPFPPRHDRTVQTPGRDVVTPEHRQRGDLRRAGA